MNSHNSSILIPKRSIILPRGRRDMGFRGFYRIQVRHSDGTLKGEAYTFPNLITDIGLNRLGTGTPFGVCAIGTGTSTPANSDTGLQTLSASTSVSAPGAAGASNSGSPDYISSYEIGYRFNAGTLSGNYSEIGIGWTSTTLWSRSRILDGGGSPTTITVLSTEYLDVFYTAQIVPDLTTHTSTVTIGASSYSVDRKPMNVNSTSYWSVLAVGSSASWCYTRGVFHAAAYNGSIGAVTSQPGGSNSILSSSAVDTYVNNSLERTGSLTFSTIQGNLSGGLITALGVAGGFQTYQYGFTPGIPKDSTRQLTVNGKVSWARV